MAITQRSLLIKDISAEGLKNVRHLHKKMDVYTDVSLDGSNPDQKTKTPVYKDCGPDNVPTWNCPVELTFDESLAKSNYLHLNFKVMCERFPRIKEIGQANVPLKALLDSLCDGHSMKVVTCQLTKRSGKPKGSLTFSYKFEDKVPEPVKPEKIKGDRPAAVGDGGHPPQAQPPQPCCGNAPPTGHGSLPALQQPPKYGLGLGVGLLGKLAAQIGEKLMVHVAYGAVANYAVGSDAGVFDDGGGGLEF